MMMIYFFANVIGINFKLCHEFEGLEFLNSPTKGL